MEDLLPFLTQAPLLMAFAGGLLLMHRLIQPHLSRIEEKFDKLTDEITLLRADMQRTSEYIRLLVDREVVKR